MLRHPVRIGQSQGQVSDALLAEDGFTNGSADKAQEIHVTKIQVSNGPATSTLGCLNAALAIPEPRVQLSGSMTTARGKGMSAFEICEKASFAKFASMRRVPGGGA